MVKNKLTMQEAWVKLQDQEDPLEKEMATYPSILAWEIPQTEKSGKLQSMGSLRVDMSDQLSIDRDRTQHLFCSPWIKDSF